MGGYPNTQPFLTNFSNSRNVYKCFDFSGGQKIFFGKSAPMMVQFLKKNTLYFSLHQGGEGGGQTGCNKCYINFFVFFLKASLSNLNIVQIDEKWEVKGSYKRWWHQDLWRAFFSDMINIPGADKVIVVINLSYILRIILLSFQESLPSLSSWRVKFQELFFKEKMEKHLKSLTNDVMSVMMSNN